MTSPRSVLPRVALDKTHRFSVDAPRDTEGLADKLARMAPLRPSGDVAVFAPFGFSYKREPDVFAAVATGTSLGTGILLGELGFFNPRYASLVGRVGSALAFVAAALLATRFLRTYFAKWTVAAEGRDVVVRDLVFGRVVRERRFCSNDVVDVLVLKGEGENARIALGGPRHELIAEIFRTRTLDPETLAPYLAELVALVARRASSPSVVPPSAE